MKLRYVRFAGLIGMLALLTACFGPETPQEAADAFWESVIENDVTGAVRYSTLTDEDQYDGFSQDWSGLQPSWGRVVIDGDEASVVTDFASPDNPAGGRHLITYLVREDEEWRVDYARTARGVNGVFSTLFGELGRLGQQIADSFAASSEDFRQEMDSMGAELEEMSISMSQQASETVEVYGEALQKSIDELAASARKALKEHKKQLSDEDRKTLDNLADELEEDSDQLADPSVQSIAESSRSVAKANQQLIMINEDVLRSYQEQWRDWQSQFEAEVQQFLDDLNAPAKAEK